MIRKILLSKGGVISDLSVDLAKYRSGSATINLTINDYLYIGQFYPFNSSFFKVSTVNNVSADMLIELWDGRKWQEVVEIIDETNTAGVPFAKSGHITWVPNKNESWSYDDTIYRDGSEKITGLGSVIVYDLYWARIKVDSTIKTDTALLWVGSLFSNDDDLIMEYPELVKNDYKSAWESGKTTWEEQHIKASEMLINDLVASRVLVHEAQIIDRYSMRSPSVAKCAEIIFNALGDDYEQNRQDARKEYEARIKKDIFNVDMNNNAILDRVEVRTRQGMLTR